MVFEKEMKAYMEHVGKNGYITDKGIMSILETVACYQSDEAGYGLLDVDTNGVSWVLLEWKIQVIQRPMYGQKLLVKTWGRNTQKVYTYRDYELYNENGELCVIATTKWVLVDITTKRITKITPDIMNNYMLSERCVFEEKELDKIIAPEQDVIRTTVFEPKNSNIDINGHVHNLDYIDCVYEALPQKVYSEGPYNNIRISYKKEIKLGDVISCNYTVSENKHVVVMKNEKDNTINCIIQLWN